VRQFGKTETAIWHNPKFRGLSEDARQLWLYLISCPHGNSIGCFLLPEEYVAYDMQWVSKRVSKHVRELVSKGFLERDETTSLTRILGWWGHNTIENANVAKAAIKLLRALPHCTTRTNAFSDLNELGNRFANEIINEFANEFRNIEPEIEPEPEPRKQLGSPQAAPPSKTVNGSLRGSRIPENWSPSGEQILFAEQQGLPPPRIEAEAAKFRDHWIAQPGQRGVKLDWDATWRNWVRRSTGYDPPPEADVADEIRQRVEEMGLG